MASRPHHDWYLQAWLDSRQMKDADLRRLTGWSKRKASELINGIQRYNRDALNDVAMALHVEPWELLMHPADANEIKQLMIATERRAIRLAHKAAEETLPFRGFEPVDDIPGGRKAG